jgi:hypothetical protein
VCACAYVPWGSHHIVSPGNEVSSPLDVGDGSFSLMENRRLPAVQPVPLVQQKLAHTHTPVNRTHLILLCTTFRRECSSAAWSIGGSKGPLQTVKLHVHSIHITSIRDHYPILPNGIIKFSISM